MCLKSGCGRSIPEGRVRCTCRVVVAGQPLKEGQMCLKSGCGGSAPEGRVRCACRVVVVGQPLKEGSDVSEEWLWQVNP